ncbi:MAG: 5-oxoprolinase subunit PxpA [Alphaproteobacteria bacterium]|nr:5-oxoprolinase subunit PxpA [Alphaproteobacteria bacterium]
MARSINLNADMGESFGAWRMGADVELFRIVASANVACGFHAGDPSVMAATVKGAVAAGVSLGAHPSFPDLQGFGRRPMRMSGAEVEAMVAYQIGALMGVAALAGGRVSHVKPHGALSNLAAVEDDLAAAIARGIRGVDRGLIFLAVAGSAMAKAGRAAGLAVAEEAFADRTYDEDGNLTSRKLDYALIRDPAKAVDHVLRMAGEGALFSVGGKRIPARIDSFCVHGDEPTAVAVAGAVRTALEGGGWRVAPLPELELAELAR